MLAEHARPFTSAPKESPIGSWPLPLTPVDFPDMRVAVCRPSRDPRLIRTNAGATAFPPTAQSARSAPSVNLFPTPRPATTPVGSPQSRNLFQISGLPPSRTAPYGIADSLMKLLEGDTWMWS